MKFKRSSLRYAHTTGYTSLVYTRDGESIVTCGSDGDIRKWTAIDDDDPSSNCLGEFVVCIAQTPDNRLLASTDRNTLQAYTFPAMDNDGTLMRFTAPVTALCVHEKYTAAGSDDTNIKVMKSDDAKTEIHLQGHKGPVLALDVCAKGELLASVAGDGCLKIWKLGDGSEVKSIDGLTKANSFESSVCFGTATFEPRHSNSLAYVKGKEVYVLNTNTWEVQFTLSDEQMNGEYTCCQFSKNGEYLAAGSTSGQISVFDFVRKLALKCESPSSDCQSITCLAWHPHKDELAYCDATGQLGTLFWWDSGSDEGNLNGNGVTGDVDDLDDMDFVDNNDMDAQDGDGIDDDDVSVDGGVSIEKLKNKVMKKALSNSNDKLDIDEDSKGSFAKSDFAGERVLPYLPKCFKKQLPFQPTATPVTLDHRYLVWNEVGIVTSHDDGADGSIDVEFHDASIHHSLHIPNFSAHNMGALSTSVLALSAECSTKLVCIALAASGNKEWTVQLPDCESVEALAASNKIVAVATNMNFLRLFSIMGTQREIISIPGPVLAMAGRDDRIIVCYHSSSPSENQQHLAALLIQVNGLHLRTQYIPLALTPNRQLTWIGFSDCGSPAFADSMGLVQLFSLKSNSWYPICDTMKQSQSVSNNYFIVSIAERSQIIQAVLCRGCAYPMTNPRPMLQELLMHMPLGDVDTEKTDLEDALVRASIMNVSNADKIIKETAIKLFALSCRSEMELRAKELIETIACPELLLLAIKYASKLGRIHLSDRLSELMPHLEEQSEHDKAEQQEFLSSPVPLMYANTDSPSTSSPTSKLAPKTMELSLSKRAQFKRFSINKTPTTLSKKVLQSGVGLLTPSNTESFTESDEKYSEKLVDTQQSEDPKENIARTVNVVNPFVAKRKLSDIDSSGKKSGIIFGSEKLKLVKKSQ